MPGAQTGRNALLNPANQFEMLTLRARDSLVRRKTDSADARLAVAHLDRRVAEALDRAAERETADNAALAQPTVQLGSTHLVGTAVDKPEVVVVEKFADTANWEQEAVVDIADWAAGHTSHRLADIAAGRHGFAPRQQFAHLS